MARGDLKTFDYYPHRAGLKTYNNSTDTFKLALLTTAYASVNKAQVDPDLSDWAEAAAGGNYTAGGNALPGNTWTIAAGTSKLDFTDFTMAKHASNPANVKTALIINSTAGNHAYHVIDLTTDGTTAIDLVNNDLNITFNANGTMNVSVTA